MQTQTFNAVQALLRTDGTLTPTERRDIATAIRNHGTPPKESEPAIISRAQAAKILNRTTRSIDDLANQGVIEKIRLPGRSRACGFRKKDVMALIQ
jgi:hypothetical protein